MKLRVLIADPDPDLQRTITAALSQERDMEAAGFSSGGTETLSQIQSLRPDVVLLELVQPRLDGLSVLRRLAEAESAPPVVVLTGFVNAAIVAECARLGAAYFIPKALRSRSASAVPAAVREGGKETARRRPRTGPRAEGAGSRARTSGKRRHQPSPRDGRTGAY